MSDHGQRELPVLPPNAQLPGCLECGACCHDCDIPLTPEELAMLDEAGTIFTLRRGASAPEAPLDGGRKIYHMVGWCACNEHSDDPNSYRCKIYDKRPAICRQFAEAGSNCRYMQLAHGVVTEEHLTQPGVEDYLEQMLRLSSAAAIAEQGNK